MRVVDAWQSHSCHVNCVKSKSQLRAAPPRLYSHTTISQTPAPAQFKGTEHYLNCSAGLRFIKWSFYGAWWMRLIMLIKESDKPSNVICQSHNDVIAMLLTAWLLSWLNLIYRHWSNMDWGRKIKICSAICILNERAINAFHFLQP